MSTIEKLSIQGIRSFGANAGDAQTIKFSPPVTLILGENGCGKTTIIECLKYALTGESPPGSDRGKNFVHDPKISGLTDALGQIKLEVRNIQGARVSVCRSMKLGMKRGKSTFETLDATMNYMNDKGRSVGGDGGGGGGGGADSISKRCVDVDVAMCQFMGVSKAIINNVLFCHQEDSSWPLDEAKKLKEKFDAIFGITEYNKAIDRIIKMRKEEMDDLKVKEANLRFLEHLKKEMEEKSMTLQTAQQKSDAIKEQCNRCDEQIKPIDERLSQIRKIEYEVGKYQAYKIELETKQKNCEEQISSLRKKVKKHFGGSIEDLDREIQSFDQRMVEKRMDRRETEDKLNSLKIEERGLQGLQADLDKKRCVVSQQKQKAEDCRHKRAEKIKELCRQLNMSIDVDVGAAGDDEITELLDDVQAVLTSEQCKIAETINEHDLEDQRAQTRIDKLRVDITRLQEGVATLQKQKANYEAEAEQSERKILEVEKSTQQLKVVTAKLQQTEECFAETSAKFNQNELRQIISDDKEKIAQLQEQFRKVDERLTFLNSIAKLVAEVSIKEKELEKREQEVRRVKTKHSDNFRKVFGEGRPVESNFRRSLQLAYEKLRTQIKELNEKANVLRLKEQSFDIKRKHLKEELQRNEKELEDCKESVYEKCHSTPYDELLAKTKATVTKYQLEHGAQKSAEALYKKYLQRIEEEPSCPLCHTCMSGDEVTKLSSELVEEIQQLPESIKRAENLLKAEQKKYESLLHLKPIIDKVARLEQDIPKHKEHIQRIQAELAECSTEAESIQMLLAEPTISLEVANSMLGDMSILDESIKEVSRLKSEIDKLKSKIPKGFDDDNVSIDDLQNEKTAISVELEERRKQWDDNQQYYEKNMEALNKLRELKNALKDQQVKLQEGIQSLPELKKRQQELHELLVATSGDIQERQAQVAPLKQELSAAAAEKNQKKDSNRLKVTQMQNKLDAHKRLDHDIQRLHNEVLEYRKQNLEMQLRNLDESLKRNREEMKRATSAIAEMSDKLEAIKVEIANQESLERDLRDNREIKVLQQKEQELTAQYEKLSKQLGELDFSKVSKEKSQLVQKRDETTIRKGELLGQIGEINSQIKKLQKELEEPKYRDSLMNYRRNYYEVEVTRRVIHDLGQHRVALEWALLQFHTEKMQEINRLIREYWRLIYRGNDIDYIQIQTDEGKADVSSADRKRNYNYRVIQSKNNSEIEMRGRCSAGQRVLASLIIRMALAETFSSNCGVLALDEPTTNLDHKNILSLCDALNRIVEERQTQSNFMLIIITHDEAFISTLGKISSYYRVFRNDECKSVIRRVEVGHNF